VLNASSSRRASSSIPIQRSLRTSFDHFSDVPLIRRKQTVVAYRFHGCSPSMPMRHGARLASRASTWPALLARQQRYAPILANDVERILADIGADHCNLAVECLGHGMLPCLRCPLASLARWQGWSMVGPFHSQKWIVLRSSRE
jgi:hypothetical protein